MKEPDYMKMKKQLELLRRCKAALTQQQYRTIRGQILSGDFSGAMKGLSKFYKEGIGK